MRGGHDAGLGGTAGGGRIEADERDEVAQLAEAVENLAQAVEGIGACWSSRGGCCGICLRLR